MMEDSRAPAVILMVGKHNVCRSPAAERLAKRHWGPGELTVSSAGSRASAGEAINLNMRHVMLIDALDPEDVRSQPLTEALLEGADLVLCMAPHDMRRAVRRRPDVRPLTFTLLEFARIARAASPYLESAGVGSRLHEIIRRAPEFQEDHPPQLDEIIDPYGHGTDAYELAYQLIKGAIVAVGRAIGSP